jgi:hypothetical protein
VLPLGRQETHAIKGRAGRSKLEHLEIIVKTIDQIIGD